MRSDLLNGLAETIRKNDDELIDAGKNLGSAIGEGLIKGFSEMGALVRIAVEQVFKLLPGWVKDLLGIGSPSKVFMDIGKWTMKGFAKGIEDNKEEPKKAASGSAEGMIKQIKDILGVHSPSTVMEEIGQDTMKGFAQGLRGGQKDVNTAFKEMHAKLNEAQAGARKAIQDNEKILAEERAKSQPDYEAIKAAEAAIAKNEEILRRTNVVQMKLIGTMVLQKNELIKLKDEYDGLTKKLGAAVDKLKEIKQKRDDLRESLTTKYSATPEIDDEATNKVWAYEDALRAQIDATTEYTDILAQLREMDLDDTTYQKLLDEGLAGKEFAEQLLAGGQTAVDSVNALDAELLAASTTLANNAASAMYDAGVKAAKSLVDGLKAERANLKAEMDFIAGMMAKAIRKALKMKSPSQIFVEIGRLTMAGLAEGLSAGREGIAQTMEGTAKSLVDATKSALAQVSSEMSGIIDMDPTITPVLDLSSVEKDAQKLGDLTNVVPITAAASYGQATSISAEQQAMEMETAARHKEVSFNFEQNNYSPEALSDLEIYRQTRNQLSQVKGALGLT